jgi:hypothetical protein
VQKKNLVGLEPSRTRFGKGLPSTAVGCCIGGGAGPAGCAAERCSCAASAAPAAPGACSATMPAAAPWIDARVELVTTLTHAHQAMQARAGGAALPTPHTPPKIAVVQTAVTGVRLIESVLCCVSVWFGWQKVWMSTLGLL